MLSNKLILKIFDAAYMKRWNDKLRPVALTELDKQAHKMIICYFIGKFEEKKDFDWIGIIEGGIFELLQRIVVTDLKPPIFYKIKNNPEKYKKLNEWVYGQLEEIISPLGEDFCYKFKTYFDKTDDTLNKRILSAAHFYATKWEFDIIERSNPYGYEIEDIKKRLQVSQGKYAELEATTRLTLYPNFRNFIDLCGLLRFQSRWSHVHRVPETSVLGHMLLVATLSYFFSLEIGACEKRIINNYFTGLFHDLPEVLTRDIISPVKESPGLAELVKDYEKEQMEKEIYSLIPTTWHSEIKMYTEDEFSNLILEKNEIKYFDCDIPDKFNKDEYSPRDGKLIKGIDKLAAFIEANEAIKNGSGSQKLKDAKKDLIKEYKGKTIAGIDFGKYIKE